MDFENLEARLVLLPPKAGNIRGLIPIEGKVVYFRAPNTRSGDRSSSLVLYDLKEREEKTIINDVDRVVATADGKSLLVRSKGKYGIIKPAPKQKIEKPNIEKPKKQEFKQYKEGKKQNVNVIGRKPRILFITDVKNWAWWIKSEYLKKYLSEYYNIDIINVISDNNQMQYNVVNQSKYDLYF